MRAIIQRVTTASVTVEGSVVGSIGKGLCVLVGITHEDTDKDLDYIVKKILNLRLFENAEGKFWANSVKDSELEILCVSQFTLYAETKKGSKPDFHKAMKSDLSSAFYGKFLDSLKKAYVAEKIKDGVFGAMMQVNINNDAI
ncbi:D-tyrosyl-tRNA(Tyr) deacylase [Entomophthora muscae]|uniref:D-tyrosyl-tRNA(Tyr) deacylase n=1 Tax=Entomophthora muscae TaxID=34485 RepID=A0ACC2UUK2_9FUNG|nr:D-tyrosyl-tRNA(Tyr) deacylase [Entomophthora muscae]